MNDAIINPISRTLCNPKFRLGPALLGPDRFGRSYRIREGSRAENPHSQSVEQCALLCVDNIQISIPAEHFVADSYSFEDAVEHAQAFQARCIGDRGRWCPGPKLRNKTMWDPCILFGATSPEPYPGLNVDLFPFKQVLKSAILDRAESMPPTVVPSKHGVHLTWNPNSAKDGRTSDDLYRISCDDEPGADAPEFIVPGCPLQLRRVLDAISRSGFDCGRIHPQNCPDSWRNHKALGWPLRPDRVLIECGKSVEFDPENPDQWSPVMDESVAPIWLVIS